MDVCYFLYTHIYIPLPYLMKASEKDPKNDIMPIVREHIL